MNVTRIKIAAETPPAGVVDQQPRCWRCNRLLAEFMARPWRIKCERCSAINSSEPLC